MNSNCFFFRKRKRPKLKKMSIQWTHCCWLSKHFFKDVKSIQVLSKFENFQPLFIFVGFCSISRKKPWSIFSLKFPNTLWFIFSSVYSRKKHWTIFEISNVIKCIIGCGISSELQQRSQQLTWKNMTSTADRKQRANYDANMWKNKFT